jgi:phosphate transport system substrate-binding protein
MARFICGLAVAALSLGAGCDQGTGSQNGKSAGTVSLTGAGATFPQPLYVKWASDYGAAQPGVRINYQGIGSGGGIKQITEKTVDFGATDGPMTEEQLKKAPGTILHIPMVLGADVPIYNLSGVSKGLVFSGPVLADLFLGKIKKWNDSRLVEPQSRRETAGQERHHRAPLRRQRDHIHLDRLPLEGE